MSSCAMAPRTPTTIVAAASTSSSVAGRVSSGKKQELGADDRVDADLGEQAGEHRGDRRRRGRVAVGQPEEQREHRGLDAEHDQQQHGEGAADAGRELADPDREVGHVDRAGRRVEQRERGDEQRRREEADDDVGHARPHLLAAPAEREQHVAGGEHHLERDEEVEQVAGEERRRRRRRRARGRRTGSRRGCARRPARRSRRRARRAASPRRRRAARPRSGRRRA